jgi:regulator of cell morphogenesis and NO signaling
MKSLRRCGAGETLSDGENEVTIMTVDTAKTVRELAVELPEAIRVFEKFGIDYCCGGHRTLEQACTASKSQVDAVLSALAAAEGARGEAPTSNWNDAPLADLMAHITNKHHTYVRQELPRLGALATKVATKHGPNHPEIKEVQEVFQALSDELSTHLLKEEQVLFPYVERMEEAAIEKRPNAQSSCFGTVQNPVRMMEMEHDSAGDALRELRTLTNGYTPPQDACMSFQALYKGLAEFEADLHQHIHLENNILFPRAIAMEAGQ